MDSYEREQIDEAYAALTDIFGEGYPQAATLTRKGDGFVGHFVRIDKDVDLKTGFAPVDMLVFRAIAGVWHTDDGAIERAAKGATYSFALMHATAKNRVDEALPIVTDEVIAVRRGRMFQSTINEGNTAVAYDVTLPNRPQPEPAKGETTPKSRAAAKRAAKSAEPTPPPPPTEEPF